ncbi:hypothetical protein GBA52_008796 [Prunus armeniaca]|nr:hypothetical protein GBA52_008796 [Prunus armeniaca]
MSKDDDGPESRGSISRPYDWLNNFQRDLMAGAVMGGVVHTIVAPIERAKLLLQTQESNLAILGVDVRDSRAWSIVSSVRFEKKAFSLFGEAMAAVFFATTLPSLSIFPSSLWQS